MSSRHRVATAPTGAAHRISSARQRLVHLIDDVHFGRICGIVVRGGEPLFDPPPSVVRTLKFGASEKPRGQHGTTDHSPALSKLFTALDLIGNGVIHKIQVADGLPLLAEVEQRANV